MSWKSKRVFNNIGSFVVASIIVEIAINIYNSSSIFPFEWEFANKILIAIPLYFLFRFFNPEKS